jgi:hypothetical protein
MGTMESQLPLEFDGHRCIHCGTMNPTGRCSKHYGVHVRRCSPDNPMPEGSNGHWEHTNVSEIGNGEYVATYQCSDCGHTWRSELPE